MFKTELGSFPKKHAGATDSPYIKDLKFVKSMGVCYRQTNVNNTLLVFITSPAELPLLWWYACTLWLTIMVWLCGQYWICLCECYLRNEELEVCWKRNPIRCCGWSATGQSNVNPLEAVTNSVTGQKFSPCALSTGVTIWHIIYPFMASLTDVITPNTGRKCTTSPAFYAMMLRVHLNFGLE